MAVQADGKIVVAGFTEYGSMVFRLNDNGSIDSSFNQTGYAFNTFSGSPITISALELQADGKIVLGGSYGIAGSGFVFLLVRYLPNGSLDTTFNHTGIANPTMPIGTSAHSIKILRNGKIIIGGTSLSHLHSSMFDTYGLARFNTDGSIDTSFGKNGYLLGIDNPNGPGESTFFTSLDEQVDGKIIAAGVYQADSGIAVFRFNENGSFDSSFGTNGIALIYFDSSVYTTAYTVRVESDGKVVVGGTSFYDADSLDKFAVGRFKSDGTPDSSFGKNQNGTVNNFCNGRTGQSYAMCLSSNRIYLGGIVDSGFAVAAYKISDVVLPIKLLSLTAQKQNNATLLQWQTADEVNNNYLSIERSGDSKLFVSIGSTLALTKNNANSYSFIDGSPLRGINFYRLKQVDNDGKYTYSKMASVAFTDKGIFAIAPNPASNFVNVTIPSSNALSDILISTSDGKTVLHQSIPASSTSTQLNIGSLADGVYNIVLIQGIKKEMLRIIKR